MDRIANLFPVHEAGTLMIKPHISLVKPTKPILTLTRQWFSLYFFIQPPIFFC